MIKSGLTVVNKLNLLGTSKLRSGSMLSQIKISRPVSQYVHSLERKNKVAVVDQFGTHTYGDLSTQSNVVANNVSRFLVQFHFCIISTYFCNRGTLCQPSHISQ